MINWELLSPRNLVVIIAFALMGVFIFNHFSSKDSDNGQ